MEDERWLCAQLRSKLASCREEGENDAPPLMVGSWQLGAQSAAIMSLDDPGLTQRLLDLLSQPAREARPPSLGTPPAGSPPPLVDDEATFPPRVEAAHDSGRPHERLHAAGELPLPAPPGDPERPPAPRQLPAPRDGDGEGYALSPSAARRFQREAEDELFQTLLLGNARQASRDNDEEVVPAVALAAQAGADASAGDPKPSPPAPEEADAALARRLQEELDGAARVAEEAAAAEVAESLSLALQLNLEEEKRAREAAEQRRSRDEKDRRLALRLMAESPVGSARETELRRQAEEDERLARRLRLEEEAAAVASASPASGLGADAAVEADRLVAERLRREWASEDAQEASAVPAAGATVEPATSPTASTAAADPVPVGAVSRVVAVPNRCVGYLCGRHMATLHKFEAETGTQITVPERDGSAVTQLVVRGRACDVAQAESIILATVSR